MPEGKVKKIVKIKRRRKIERRFLRKEPFNLNESENIVSGYAAVFNKKVLIYGYTEVIRRGAFSKTLNDGADVRALINHDPNKILGRTVNGTLKLEEDEKGLKYELQLDDTTYAKDLLKSIKRKDITQNSFGFEIIQQKTDHNKLMREITEVKLFDISPVTFPAYPDAKIIGVRSGFEALGINYEELDSILIRAGQNIKLTEHDCNVLQSSINVFNSYLPEKFRYKESAVEENATNKDEVKKEPDFSTLLRMRELMLTANKCIKGV